MICRHVFTKHSSQTLLDVVTLRDVQDSNFPNPASAGSGWIYELKSGPAAPNPAKSGQKSDRSRNWPDLPKQARLAKTGWMPDLPEPKSGTSLQSVLFNKLVVDCGVISYNCSVLSVVWNEWVNNFFTSRLTYSLIGHSRDDAAMCRLQWYKSNCNVFSWYLSDWYMLN